MSVPDKVKCPTCKKVGDWFATPFGPFCSKRCRLVDLGKWFTEENAIFTGDIDSLRLSSGERTIYQWFNTSTGFERNSSRQLASNLRVLSSRFSSLRGDAMNNWDLSLVKNTQIVEELSLPPVKIHCSVLAEDAIRAAINDYKKKNGLPVEERQAASAH